MCWHCSTRRGARRFTSVVSRMFFEKTTADPSTHHPQAEKRLGPRSLRMTTLVLLRTLGTGHSCYDRVILSLLDSRFPTLSPEQRRKDEARIWYKNKRSGTSPFSVRRGCVRA